MRIVLKQMTLNLNLPFHLAHGTSTQRDNLLVRIGQGIGEAPVVPYYGYTLQSLRDACQNLHLNITNPRWLEQALDALPPLPFPLKSALDMALHDVWGQALDAPLYALWGLNPDQAQPTSITVAIAPEPEFRAEVLRVAPFVQALKIKVGSGDVQKDETLIRIARESFTGMLGIDTNGGWSVQDTLTMIPLLNEIGCEYIEQPVPQGDIKNWVELRNNLTTPHPLLFADESFQTPPDIFNLHQLADGINIKLAKCGGLREARHAIILAKTFGMRVMLGCMIESSVGITAAAHLAALAHYVDLDGNLLIADDPFCGVTVEQGRLVLPTASGLGVRPRCHEQSSSATEKKFTP